MSSNETCPVCHTAEIISGKWTLLLIRDLAAGRSRFCELERSLDGISPRTLSLRLRALEGEGIVERRTYPEVPPRVEYRLTPKGAALRPVYEQIAAWARDWIEGAAEELGACPTSGAAQPERAGRARAASERSAAAVE